MCFGPAQVAAALAPPAFEYRRSAHRPAAVVGSETAAVIDEEKVGSIPGFGSNLTAGQLARRARLEPLDITDPRDVQQIDGELRHGVCAT